MFIITTTKLSQLQHFEKVTPSLWSDLQCHR